MLFAFCRLMRVMSGLQHVAVFITVLGIPASFDLLQGLARTGYCPSCLDLGRASLYVGWYVVAEFIMSLALRSDRSKVDEKFEQISGGLLSRISKGEEKIDKNIADASFEVECLQKRVDSIENFMRRHLSLRLPVMAFMRGGLRVEAGFSADISGTVIKSPSNWRRRIYLSAMGQWRRLRRWLFRIVVDWRH